MSAVLEIRPRRVKGILLNNLYTLRHSPIRIAELFYWPFIEVVLWGFLSNYLRGRTQVPGGVGVFLGAVVLWDVLFRAQQELAMTYMMNMWDRSIVNLFSSPLKQVEQVLGDVLFSLGRVLIGTTFLVIFTKVAFDFSLLDTGRVLLPSLLVLLGFGWALGLAIRSAVMRFGSNAEVLAWSLAFLFQPVAAVYYPVSSLPGPLQPVAHAVPASHVFEAIRAFLTDGTVLTGQLVQAALLDVVYLALGAWILARSYRAVRVKGLLSRPGY
jgi:ABC-2 type transport system permease protein